MNTRFSILLAVAVATSYPALAQTTRDLTLEQLTAAQAGQPQPGKLQITGSVDREDLTYAVTETVRIFLEANEDAYVTVVNVGPTGHVTQLFPNSFQTNNRLKADEKIEVPAAESGSRITVTGPVGFELIKVIASKEPTKIIPESELEGKGVFRELKGGVNGLVKNLEVVGNPPVPEQKYAVHNVIIKTVASRAGSRP